MLLSYFYAHMWKEKYRKKLMRLLGMKTFFLLEVLLAGLRIKLIRDRLTGKKKTKV